MYAVANSSERIIIEETGKTYENRPLLILKVSSDLKILELLKEKYQNEQITTIDGLKIDFKDGWVHLRKSNTEPIIRIYAEAPKQDQAQEIIRQVNSVIGKQ